MPTLPEEMPRLLQTYLNHTAAGSDIVGELQTGCSAATFAAVMTAVPRVQRAERAAEYVND